MTTNGLRVDDERVTWGEAAHLDAVLSIRHGIEDIVAMRLLLPAVA